MVGFEVGAGVVVGVWDSASGLGFGFELGLKIIIIKYLNNNLTQDDLIICDKIEVNTLQKSRKIL